VKAIAALLSWISRGFSPSGRRVQTCVEPFGWLIIRPNR